MSVGLLAPAALAALIALLLPLLLHLARRDATRPTPFAALRWLRERPKPRRRLRFDDWPLLLVRLLLLALLAVWLAWPVLHGETAPARWTIVAPGVADEALPRTEDGAPAPRWLAPGFPEVSRESAPARNGASVASLLRELDMTAPAGTALTVLVPDTIDGADGGRVVLSRPVDWRIVAGSEPGTDASPILPPRLDVFGIAADDPALRVLRAVARAWRPDDADALRIANGDEAPRADAIAVWWGHTAPPAALRTETAGRVLLLGPDVPREEIDWQSLQQDANGAAVFERAVCGEATCVRFAQAVDPATMPLVLDPEFPSRLRELLQPLPAPQRIAATDLAPSTGADAWPPTPRDLRPWWALLVALAFALERWMAAAPRRNRAA
ncbi:BatA domain-containing protein [Luteimonas sp. XNQY3]|nr:BatA domain-containing protein [Luteimonas sp. XNQY3]MCD9005343.1 BatA domain-containing protein [Luteimonas sp. XNQY3]